MVPFWLICTVAYPELIIWPGYCRCWRWLHPGQRQRRPARARVNVPVTALLAAFSATEPGVSVSVKVMPAVGLRHRIRGRCYEV